jgi:hypothetical protein
VVIGLSANNSRNLPTQSCVAGSAVDRGSKWGDGPWGTWGASLSTIVMNLLRNMTR